MKVLPNELILNHITVGELFPLYRDEFSEYQRCAAMFLATKNRHLFENDILKLYGEGVTLETILDQNKHRFVEGPPMLNNGKSEPTWYDIFGIDEIRRGDELFDFFFACKLRHVNAYHLDEFLDFHLGYNFGNKKPDYLRFLQIMLRQYQQVYEKYPVDTHIPGVVREWMEIAQARQEEDTRANVEKKIKGRQERTADDKQTCLTQVQTALLAAFMQRAGLILNDRTLNFAQIGQAFNVLTGYSSTTLRLGVGSKNVIDSAKFEDFKDLHEAIIRMANMIEAHTRKK